MIISRKRNQLIRSLKIALIIFLFILPIFLIFRTNFFNIKQIDISMDKIRCTDEDKLKKLSALYGQNFFLINITNLTQNLKKNFYCISSVNLSKIFPNKVKLEVFGRTPAAILITLKSAEASQSSLVEFIATPSAQQSIASYLVDKEGVIFSKNINGLNIPEIYSYNSNIFLGESLKDNLIIDSLKIIEKVKTFRVEIKETLISDKFFIINSEPKIIFSLQNNIDIQLASLQLILDKAKIDFSKLELVDLRFDKPIIKIAPKKN